MRSVRRVSNPRAALLQGLEKMKILADRGLTQAVLPPHERPDQEALRRLGFRGGDVQIIEQAAKQAPILLASCCSASAMWAANSATVSPSADTDDGRVHITPANLVSQFHRSLESSFTAAALKRIFPEDKFFAHHVPLPAGLHFSDEGAANHTRLCSEYAAAGIELFVYGRDAFDAAGAGPGVFPARQTRQASEALARLHGLHESRTVFARQNPAAIDAGVFHNDVISVGNGKVFVYHSDAFENTRGVIEELREKYLRAAQEELVAIEVASEMVTIREAVETYFFNSQIVTLPGGDMLLLAPVEAALNDRTTEALSRICTAQDNPIVAWERVDLRQSMQNGGGPACLRLRVVLSEDELRCVHKGVLYTPRLHEELAAWGDRHYRDRLAPDDLADPELLWESRASLDSLTEILGLGSIYRFQKSGA
jgi:succinylarginine dihydrolase